MKKILLLALMLVTSMVFAKEDVVTVQAYPVATYTSNPGESYQAFVLRVAENLRDWAAVNGQEACGPFAKYPDGRFVVELTTEKVQEACIIDTKAPEGATLVGDSIHDHPKGVSGGDFKLTATDCAFFLAMGESQSANACREHRYGVYVKGERPYDFSDDDFRGGAGYLVTMEDQHLRYQHGEGTSKDLGAVPATSSTTDVASVNH
jgi:hypothetical protein